MLDPPCFERSEQLKLISDQTITHLTQFFALSNNKVSLPVYQSKSRIHVLVSGPAEGDTGILFVLSPGQVPEDHMHFRYSSHCYEHMTGPNFIQYFETALTMLSRKVNGQILYDLTSNRAGRCKLGRY